MADEMSSTKDRQVLASATGRDEVLLTAEKDFGGIEHNRGHQHAGVVLMRMNERSPTDRVARALMVISIQETRLKNAFTVISSKRVRVRPAPEQG